MQTLNARCLGVAQSGGYAIAKFAFPTLNTGNTAFALGPIARWHIEQGLSELIVLKPLSNLVGIMFIGKQIFDRSKALIGGGGKAIQKRMLGKHHR